MNRLPIFPLYFILFFAALSSCHQGVNEDMIYFDKNKPGISPQIFAPGVVSKKGRSEFGSVFNARGDEFYFAIDSGGHAKILAIKIIDGKWTEPRTILSDSNYSLNDPFLSIDESKLYYISDKLKSETDTIKDYDIWYSTREGNSFSEPIHAGPTINTDTNEYYISFTEKGDMYFSSNMGNKRKGNFDIYKSVFRNGEYQEPEKLPATVNTNRYEADVFVARDESYLIFCGRGRGGYGIGDLYISFLNEKGEWAEAINMGTEINTKEHELCPFVTQDGRFFFYTSKRDIYWVSTDIFNTLRKQSK